MNDLDDPSYIEKVQAMCVEHGFNPTAAYDYRSAKASFAQVRRDLAYKRSLVEIYDAALTLAARAAADARIRASKKEEAEVAEYYRAKREAAAQQTKH